MNLRKLMFNKDELCTEKSGCDEQNATSADAYER